MALYPTHTISVCSGYGGIDLGLRLALGGRCRTVLYCEREAYAAAILVAQMEAGHLDAAPVWSDLATLPARGIIDRMGIDPAGAVMHGGIPCQPWSAAGQRRGAGDERWLWPTFWRVARESKVGWIFLENVRRFVSGDDSGLELVLRDLSEAGWHAEWDVFSAAQCGAPHERERFFLLAHAGEGGCGQELSQNDLLKRESASTGGRRNVGNPKCAVRRAGNSQRCEMVRKGGVPKGWDEASGGPSESGAIPYWPSRPGEEQYPWEPPRLVVYPSRPRREQRERHEVSGLPVPQDSIGSGGSGKAQSGLGGNSHGPACRVDPSGKALWTGRVSALGNGVVPVVAAIAWETLWGRLTA